jgi:hypothetical protein
MRCLRSCAVNLTAAVTGTSPQRVALTIAVTVTHIISLVVTATLVFAFPLACGDLAAAVDVALHCVRSARMWLRPLGHELVQR